MIALLGACLAMNAVAPPVAYGALPTDAQLRWHERPYYSLIHFGPNTFTNVEWGHGKEDPDVFNPSQLDCRQWAKTIKDAGMTGVILVAKHHDGFCMWPTKTSKHSVQYTKWGGGKRDVIREMSDAAKEFGLDFAVYLSPWDQNHPLYGTGDQYNEIYREQVRELTTNYGPFFMFWVDGANGEGPNGKKQIYDWPSFFGTILKHQPEAVIFSDIGPGARWVGNESGVAGETNWCTLDTTKLGPGNSVASKVNPSGQMGAPAWVPAECDTPLRPGWFYHADQDNKVRPLENLIETWFSSVGRNASLNFGLAPDRRGLIHENDAAALKEFREWRDAAFGNDLLKGSWAKSSDNRGGSSDYAASNMVDDDAASYFATDDGKTSATIEFRMGDEKSVNCIELQEHIALGQRVESFEVDAWLNGEWKKVATGTTIGARRQLRFDRVSTSRLRVRILDSLACPVLKRASAYNVPSVEEFKSQK